jgi:type VI secretion system protein ImpA
MPDLKSLLEPISEGDPCGVDLTLDGTLMLLEQKITPDSESNQEPNWSEVHDAALEALGQGRDLRVAVILSLAAFKEEGPIGMRDGMVFINGLLERYPDKVHPVPDGDSDPTRGSALSNLSAPVGSDSPYKFVRWLRESPLVTTAGGSKFSLGDLIRAGSVQPQAPQEGEEGQPSSIAPTRDQIESAFREAGPEAMQKTAAVFAEIKAQAEAIENALSSHEGSKSGLDLKALKEMLAEIQGELKPWTGQIEAGQADGAQAQAQQAGGAVAGAGVPGAIRSRTDADNAIRAVCSYFRQNEPSSPIPYFLERVRRLIGKDFVECVRDLSAESLEKFYPLFGINPSEQSSQEQQTEN